MSTEIRVPQLGESVVEATIARWLKQVGDVVAPGDAVVELETEKVNIEVPADAGGTLTQITHQDGETVKIGDVLGLLDGGGVATVPETDSAQTQSASPPPPVPPIAPGGQTAPAAPRGGATAEATSAGRAGAPPQVAETEPAGAAPAAPSARDGISPVAQRIAAEHGIDPARLDGHGPGGRIMKEDVLGVVQRVPAATAAAPSAIPPVSPSAAAAPSPAPRPQLAAARTSGDLRGEDRIRLSRRRVTIARRLVEAQQTAAMLTTFNEVDMTAVMELRKRRRDAFKERHGVNLGFMSFFTKASIGALKAFPNVNAEMQGEELVLKRYYDVGVAVSTEEGLVVPVVRDADRKTFAQIEQEIGSLATRARERKLTLEELRGGTFTITNGGVFGSLLSTPILNPPQVGILGMHTIKERPVVVGGQVVARPMMYLALSYDHRVVDGREAVSFLVRVKELIEDPETLLLEG